MDDVGELLGRALKGHRAADGIRLTAERLDTLGSLPSAAGETHSQEPAKKRRTPCVPP
ncbi:hypothetical protein [Streptomyces sp. NPDC050164]|uniref:hypothetical protein n=1 Tax=Streptomyces sp. NPDC050164 TaxID=3365605 RepID=UPI003793CD5F